MFVCLLLSIDINIGKSAVSGRLHLDAGVVVESQGAGGCLLPVVLLYLRTCSDHVLEHHHPFHWFCLAHRAAHLVEACCYFLENHKLSAVEADVVLAVHTD